MEKMRRALVLRGAPDDRDRPDDVDVGRSSVTGCDAVAQLDSGTLWSTEASRTRWAAARTKDDVVFFSQRQHQLGTP